MKGRNGLVFGTPSILFAGLRDSFSDYYKLQISSFTPSLHHPHPHPLHTLFVLSISLYSVGFHSLSFNNPTYSVIHVPLGTLPYLHLHYPLTSLSLSLSNNIKKDIAAQIFHGRLTGRRRRWQHALHRASIQEQHTGRGYMRLLSSRKAREVGVFFFSDSRFSFVFVFFSVVQI